MSGDSSSLPRELLAGFLGAGIALACLLPPLIHLVSGPLGPAIGAFVVGNHFKPGTRGRAVIAVTIGCVLSAIVGGALLAIRSASGATPPSWFPASDIVGMIVGGVLVWAGALAAIGVGFSSAVASRTT